MANSMSPNSNFPKKKRKKGGGGGVGGDKGKRK